MTATPPALVTPLTVGWPITLTAAPATGALPVLTVTMSINDDPERTAADDVHVLPSIDGQTEAESAGGGAATTMP